MQTFFKNKKLVSPKMKALAKGRGCTLRVPTVCNGGGGTAVMAHLNSHRKGWGNKSPDLWTVISCGPCHDWLDWRLGKSRMEEVETMVNRYKIILEALFETQEIASNEGIIILK